MNEQKRPHPPIAFSATTEPVWAIYRYDSDEEGVSYVAHRVIGFGLTTEYDAFNDSFIPNCTPFAWDDEWNHIDEASNIGGTNYAYQGLIYGGLPTIITTQPCLSALAQREIAELSLKQAAERAV